MDWVVQKRLSTHAVPCRLLNMFKEALYVVCKYRLAFRHRTFALHLQDIPLRHSARNIVSQLDQISSSRIMVYASQSPADTSW